MTVLGVLAAGVPEIGRMAPYGIEHVAVLAAILVACLVLVPVARRYGSTPLGRGAVTACGWLLLASSLFTTALGLLPSAWNINESLPFHMSDWLRFILSVALITRAQWAIVVSVFWGLTLNLQSILTPDVRYFTNPPLEFLQYWGFHGVAFVAAVVFVWGLGLFPTWRGYAVAYGIAFLWATIALVVNALTGANYGYLAHAPAGPSVLDLLGPWPVYVVWELVLVASVWALMTWGFTRARRAVPVVPGALVRETGVGRVRGGSARVALARAVGDDDAPGDLMRRATSP